MEQKNKQKNKYASVQKLKLLVTVINRSKAMYFIHLLENYDVTMQTIILGKGTANSDMLNLLGLAETEKAVILSCIRESNSKKILEVLGEQFEKVKDGKGVAYTIPLQSIIGVSVYQFLSNNTQNIKGGNENE